MKATPEKLNKKSILRGIEDFLNLTEIADSVEFTFKFNKESVPTVSYKISGFPINAGTTSNDCAD